MRRGRDPPDDAKHGRHYGALVDEPHLLIPYVLIVCSIHCVPEAIRTSGILWLTGISNIGRFLNFMFGLERSHA